MQSILKNTSLGAIGMAVMLATAPTLEAQNRPLALPRGSVIIVRTTTPIQSANAQVGQTFETVVVDSLSIDNYSVLPSGSRIRGVIRLVTPATRQQSGVLEVDFDRITFSDGTTVPIQGRLTSVDSAERRQIESSANQRVVLVGGRGGIGAAIAGAGSSSSSSSLLGALGALLSQGENVNVPTGTPLAVQLEQRLVLRGRGQARRASLATIYTDAERIREAQRALAAQDYYRGPIDGELTYATQRAIFEYQSDRDITATGNLDGRTAQALGLSLDIGGSVGGSTALTVAEASTLRRNSQTLAARVRQELGVTTSGQLNARRTYSQGELELWFAMSAFSDNSSLYEQIVRTSSTNDGALLSGRALVNAAQRVDTAMTGVRPTAALRNEWTSIRAQLSRLDTTYR